MNFTLRHFGYSITQVINCERHDIPNLLKVDDAIPVFYSFCFLYYEDSVNVMISTVLTFMETLFLVDDRMNTFYTSKHL